jgi:hypothetical protein
MGAGFLYLYLQAKGFQITRGTPSGKKKKSSHLKLVKGQDSRNRDEDDRNNDPKTWH